METRLGGCELKNNRKSVMPYRVENVELKKTSKGAPYMSLKIDNKAVSFWHKSDFDLQIKAGDLVECKIDQNGNYYNGSDLKLIPNEIPMTSPGNGAVMSNERYLKGIFEQLKRIADFLYKTN